MRTNNFKKQEYERRKMKEKQNKELARSLFKQGYNISYIAMYVGVNEAIVRRVYLKGLIEEDK